MERAIYIQGEVLDVLCPWPFATMDQSSYFWPQVEIRGLVVRVLPNQLALPSQFLSTPPGWYVVEGNEDEEGSAVGMTEAQEQPA